MWLAFAVLSAFFAGITAVLSKVGIKNVNSNLGTAIRTVIVFIFSWIMVFVAGAQNGVFTMGTKTPVFLILSGFATGGGCAISARSKSATSTKSPLSTS